MARRKRPHIRPFGGQARWRVLGLVVPAILVAGAAFPAFSQQIGDGSGTDNPALLGRSAQTQAQCAYWWQCRDSGSQPATQQAAPPPQPTQRLVVAPQRLAPAPQPVSRQNDCDVTQAGGATPADCPVDLAQGVPVVAQMDPVVANSLPLPVDPVQTQSIAPQQGYERSVGAPRGFALEPDWNVGLRAGFENGANGSQFVISVLPSVRLRHGFARGGVTLGASSEIALEQNGGIRIASGAISAEGDYAIGRNTNLRGGVNLSASQESAFSSGAAAGVAAQPLIISGGAEGAVTHEFGRGALEVRGNVQRQVYGVTRMQSGTLVDNSYRSRFVFGGGLRASYGITKTTRVFADGTIERNMYDAASPTAGVALDSWTWGLRGGLTMNLGRVANVELAAGYGLRNFDAAALTDTPGWLASAQINVRPEERLSFSGNVSTEFVVPDGGPATSEIDYVAGLAAQYRVTDQLTFRANVGAEWRDVIGAPDGWEVTAGAGADFAINKQTTLSADYAYTTGQDGAAARTDNHRVSLGVRYGRTRLGVSN